MRRIPLLLAFLALLLAPTSALGHAILVKTSPKAESSGNTAPTEITMQFSESVTLLKPTDVEVVNEEGADVLGGTPQVSPGDVRVVEAKLRPGLPDGTYTVRYRVVSADSHIIPGAYAFGVGAGAVKPPNLGGNTADGPSMTGVWSVSARFFELVCLGGLLGLTAFRWLVWAPAWRRNELSHLPAASRTAGLEWGRDVYWVAFGALAVASMVAETYLLIVYSAAALGTTVTNALTNTAGISTVLSTTRLGSLVQLRGGLLFVLFAIGAWQFMAEYGSSHKAKPAEPAGPRVPAMLMAGLVIAVLYGVATQGHASQAPFPRFQVAADLLHMCGAAVWAAGLVVTLATLWRLPQRMPTDGDVTAAAVLARFSNVALWAMGLIIASGVVRTFGEIDAPEDLWNTTWGKVLVAKLVVLGMIGPLAMLNRRVVNTLQITGRGHAAGVRLVRRAALVEIVGSLVLVTLAALLVAEVPGRV